jgi:anaerobic ribonucleoside-triphosphate reductase activating protein
LKFSEDELNIGRLLPRSGVNGPGERFVVWLQGCNLKCPGCINQEFLPAEPKLVISVSKIHKLIVSTSGIEGVTYSGGEPFEQAKPLYHLSALLKKKGLSIMSYSGYTYDELLRRKDRYAKKLLGMLDILIDGRFEADNAAPLLWRGSANQKVHFLTAKYKDYEKMINRENTDMEISVSNKDISFTGNFNNKILGKIKKKLSQGYGVMLK